MKSKGFTLVELLVVMVMISVMVAIIGGGSCTLTGQQISGTVIQCENLGLIMSGDRQNGMSMTTNFAIDLKCDDSSEIIFSATDRKWAVVKPGDYIVANVNKYTILNPWKNGQFYNGRLISKKSAR